MILDETDWEIIRELFRWEGNHPQGALRVPVREISKRVAQHPNTVRARLVALRKGGVVEGSAFDPYPPVVGLVRAGWMCWGVRPVNAQEVESRLPTGCIAVAVTGPDWLFLHIWETSDDAAAKRAEEVAHEFGARSIERHYTSTDFPPRIGGLPELSELDRRLVVALRKGPTRSMAAVARELKVSSRTAERRAIRLIQTGAGGMSPRFRIGRVEGAIIVHYLVVEGDARAAPSLAKAFPDRLFGPFGTGINAGVAVPVASLDEAERRRRDAERLPGVRSLSALLCRDTIFPASFDQRLAEVVASSRSRGGRG